jgi:hypothetical protein
MTLLFAMRNSWLDMATFLKMVEQKELWKKWDFKSFSAFYEQEYELTLAEVKVLKFGADTVGRVAPEVLKQAPEKREVPSLKVVKAFSKAEEKVGAEAMAEVGKAIFKEDKPAAHKLALIKEAVKAAPKSQVEEKDKAKEPGQEAKRVADLARKLRGEIEKLADVPKALREQAASLSAGLDAMAEKHKAA